MLRTGAVMRFVAAAVGALALCLPVRADNHPGADVICADLPDCTSYGAVGAVGMYAYAVGTTSCNVGNANLRWQAGTPYHPVIAQSVYRMRDGRFEQIGASWVKHGFFAFGQSLCGTCNGQTGATLGVGCSDPYDNGLNGEQSGLGPRSEINPSTGVFPFAAQHNWPAATDALSRRIQIAAGDITPPVSTGAAYFAEGIYISPDDGAAGNSWNNASHRSAAFNAASPMLAMSVSGAVTRERPALFAWRAADAGVHIAGLDVPGDGRFYIAERVTDNHDGTWRYEYAVMNLTSDRGAGEFVVPIAPGTVVTVTGFHGVPAHSGEPYSGAPWVAAVTAEAVTFSPGQTFAQDPNANALRWGMLYNFRFDASAGPANGSARIGLFKPPPAGAGTNASIDGLVIGVRTPGGAAIAAGAPPNDECPGAATVRAGENRVATFGATGIAPLPCGTTSGDAWYRYVYQPGAPNCTGTITIDTCGSEVDTSIAVYSSPLSGAGACDATVGGGAGGLVACNDDGGPCAAIGGVAGSSSVSFPAGATGTNYLIRVGSPTGARGNVVLNVSVPFCVPANGACCSGNGACQIAQGSGSCYGGGFMGSGTTCSLNPCAQPPPPVNDACAGALGIGDSALGWPGVSGSNYGADTTVSDLCAFGAQGLRDVWYAYVPTITGTVAVDTCQVPAGGTPLDTLVSVHEGACDGPLIGCNDNAFGYCIPGSRVEATLSAGTLYYIRVAGYGNAVGDFVVRVTGGAGAARGACCWGAACIQSSPTGCLGPNKAFAGLSTTCNPAGSATTPCCRADFNHGGGITVLDIFEYLSEWFAGGVAAAVGGNGIRTPVVQDIFDFLGAWFAGC